MSAIVKAFKQLEFRNSNKSEINDVHYDGPPFKLANQLYNFIISPKNQYWRFGLKLSKTQTIDFDPLGRYSLPDYKYIQIVVGKILSEELKESPNFIELGNMVPDEHPFDKKETYVAFSDVDLRVFHNSSDNLLYISYSAKDLLPFVRTMPIEDYRYFQIFAWADWNEFDLQVSIEESTVLINSEAEITSINVGNTVFRLGDMFEYEAISKTNLILLPASSTGSVTPNISNRASELEIPDPPRKPAGTLFIHKTPVNATFPLYAGYAYSVDDYTSSPEIISKICNTLLTTLQEDKLLNDNKIKGVNLPLLGTGAGSLDSTEIAEIYNKEFNQRRLFQEFIISVQSSELFRKIKAFFKGKYFPCFPENQYQKPIQILGIEEELNVFFEKNDYDVDLNGQIIELNLSRIKITNIEFLKKHKEIRRLNLDYCVITDYNPLTKLAKLHTLYISDNRLINLKIIGKLKWLQTLDVSYNQIEDLTFLQNLKKLNSLDLRGNKIVDIGILSALTNLKYLSLSNNQIDDVRPVAKLIHLQNLNLSHNQITSLPDLVNFSDLSILDISKNKIDSIEPISLLNNLTYLKADLNPFSDRSNLILKEDENHLPLIKNLMIREGEGDKKRFYLPGKVLLLGNHASGKSSLLEYIQRGEIKLNQTSTHIIKIEKYPIRSKNIPQAIFFDFGGQDYYHGLYRAFLSGGSIYLLLWNADQNINSPREDSHGVLTQDFNLNYWLSQKKHLENKMNLDKIDPILLIQSYSDKNKRISFYNKEENYIIQNEFYVSLKGIIRTLQTRDERNNVNKKALEYLKESILELIESTRISLNVPQWYIGFLQYIIDQNSKADYKAKSVSKEVINQYQRDQTDKLELIKEDLDQFHKQGLVLYYKELNPDEVWLNPVALVKYVHSKILNRELMVKWKGQVPFTEFGKYDTGIINFLQQQKVIFLHEHGERGKEYIIPNFLPLTEECKTEFDLYTFEMTTPNFSLKFKNFLPFGLINQFICFFGKRPERKKFWRDQLLFTFQGRAKILIYLNFSSLEIIVNISFFKDTKEQDRQNVIRYVFYGIISLYWGFEPLEFDDFIGFANRTLTKDNFHPEHDLYQKFSNAERIYEREEYRPTDLFISLDRKYYVNYWTLWSSNSDSKLTESRMLNENGELGNKSKEIPIYPFGLFINKTFAKMKKLFISYSKYDESYKEEFRKHLVTLKEQGFVESFNCKEIDLGDEWDAAIQREVDECDIMICLVSVDFLNTSYIRKYEVEKAISKEKKLIPIIIKPCDWEDSNIGKFFASLRGQAVSLDPNLFLQDRIREHSDIERAAAWTKVIKEFREKLFLK